MKVTDVQELLTPFGLSTPDLEMLRPTEKQYTALLLQPSGPIFANDMRIGNLDAESAGVKGFEFLELAKNRGAHLALTPEYYLPWLALQRAIADSVVPAADALWVLGCESITPDQLESFKHAVSAQCRVIHESFNDTLPANGVLLDPVVLLFNAHHATENNQLVALIQFKTFPSRDDRFFEERVLKRGTDIYRFRGKTGHLSVAAVVCSDAFPLSDLVDEFIDRSTLIHIQLNPDPRHTAYRAYRAKTFLTDPKVSDCHIICLNWARFMEQHGDKGTKPDVWPNIAGSAWYCPADGCSAADDIIASNHEKGLYYTCLKTERRHALLFHYDEAVFELRVPKLVTVGPAVMANRNGPSAVGRYTWENNGKKWDEVTAPPDTGFNSLLDANPDANAALAHAIATTDALGIERILTLSAGTISGGDRWHVANNIDSCQMEPDEVVHRITVVQDPCPKASDFRHSRLGRIASLRHEITNIAEWPPQVVGMNHHARILWNRGNPHFNVMTENGQPTLVVHLGDIPSARALENVPDMLLNLLRRADRATEKRLCILYRQYGDQKFAPIPGLTRYDDALDDMTDILTVQPLQIIKEDDHA